MAPEVSGYIQAPAVGLNARLSGRGFNEPQLTLYAWRLWCAYLYWDRHISDRTATRPIDDSAHSRKGPMEQLMSGP